MDVTDRQTDAPALRALLDRSEPLLALAPMLNVADAAFWRVIGRHGHPDVYCTEYFRVYATSRLDEEALLAILESAGGRPVVAQLMGNDAAALVESARRLQELPIAAVDLNLGCPAPIVYRKFAGGGLLRDPRRVDEIVGALREAVTTVFSVKTRLGFDSAEHFDDLLEIFARHGPDLVTVHARTVTEMYGPDVRYEYVRRAVDALPCPVLANGSIRSSSHAMEVLRTTGARGLMIGRGAVRNPWMFRQIRDRVAGTAVRLPVGRDVLAYVRGLVAELSTVPGYERGPLGRMKRLTKFLAAGVEPTGRFLTEVRRAHTVAEFDDVCVAHLDHDRPLTLEPWPAVGEA